MYKNPLENPIPGHHTDDTDFETNINEYESQNPIDDWRYLEVSKEKLQDIKLLDVNDPKYNGLDIKNLDQYELEKIKSSYQDLLRISDTMKRYMDKMSELEEKGIKILGTQNTFDQLRFPGGLFGPDGALKDFNKMQLSMALILDRINTLEKTTGKE